jgi:hypothetical protein
MRGLDDDQAIYDTLNFVTSYSTSTISSSFKSSLVS